MFKSIIGSATALIVFAGFGNIYNENSLTLKGTKGNVRLVVNFIDNIISGEWPGHSMAPLYEVTRVEKTCYQRSGP